MEISKSVKNKKQEVNKRTQRLDKMIEWQTLENHYTQISKTSIKALFSQDSLRFERHHIQTDELFFDYSKNRITDETIDLLCHLAESCNLNQAIEDLFSGKNVNYSENRAALHTAFRTLNNHPIYVNQKNIMSDIHETWERVEKISTRITNQELFGFSEKPITEIIHIGIGGSCLGPQLLYEAFLPYKNNDINCHFISNYDDKLEHLFQKLSPEKTLIIVCSKSFKSPEVLFHTKKSLLWLSQAGGKAAIQKQCLVVTENISEALSLGILKSNIFPLWDWVVGRFSISSPISLSVICAIGMDRFKDFLKGANAIDDHFRTTDFRKNIPVIKALLAIWYSNFFKIQSCAIIPYSTKLFLFPGYLQQLFMESLGKSVQQEGLPVNYETGNIIWGGIGVNSQHSFHQLLLQGTQQSVIDFILPIRSSEDNEVETQLLANCLAQSHVLMKGNDIKAFPHKCIKGNSPNSVLLINKVSPEALGALIACYEHQVYTQAVIWNINPFDQWGVQYGKEIQKNILAHFDKDKFDFNLDPSTLGLMQYIRFSV